MTRCTASRLVAWHDHHPGVRACLHLIASHANQQLCKPAKRLAAGLANPDSHFSTVDVPCSSQLCFAALRGTSASIANQRQDRLCRAQVALACHVPKALADEKEVGAKEWFETVTKAMGGEVEVVEETEECIVAKCMGSKEKELFPLKMRDAGSSAGYQMLLKKGLIPQDGAHLTSMHLRCAACASVACLQTGARNSSDDALQRCAHCSHIHTVSLLHVLTISCMSMSLCFPCAWRILQCHNATCHDAVGRVTVQCWQV